MHGRFQNRRIRSGKRPQPPHPAGVRGPDAGLSSLQTRSGKQFLRFPGKIGIRPGRFFAEAGKVFHRCAVGALQCRQRRTAHPVAGIGIGFVRLVRHPALPGCTAEAFGILPGKGQQRPQIRPASGPDACCAVHPRTPGQTQQQGLRLIICSMGCCNGVYPLSAQTLKAGVAQAAGPILPGMFQHRAKLFRMEHPQRHAQTGAFGTHKGFVPVGALTPQAMVHMAGRKLKSELRLQGQQDAQQRHAVCPAGHCRRQMQLMQRGTRGQQCFLQTVFPHPGKDRFVFHQRLKSTSIKRVWAPSQPSGTVLVSP